MVTLTFLLNAIVKAEFRAGQYDNIYHYRDTFPHNMLFEHMVDILKQHFRIACLIMK